MFLPKGVHVKIHLVPVLFTVLALSACAPRQAVFSPTTGVLYRGAENDVVVAVKQFCTATNPYNLVTFSNFSARSEPDPAGPGQYVICESELALDFTGMQKVTLRVGVGPTDNRTPNIAVVLASLRAKGNPDVVARLYAALDKQFSRY